MIFLSGILFAFPEATTRSWRENAIDELLLDTGPPQSRGVVVVDIDRESIAAVGRWPWPRKDLARIIDRIAESGASVVAIDIVLAGPQADDPILVRSMGAVPVVLGAFLSDTGDTAANPHLHQASIALQGEAPSLRPWHERAILGPEANLADAAAAVAWSSIAADADGQVRRIPIFATGADTVLGGIAAEALRIHSHAGAFIIDGSDDTVRIGPDVVSLNASADARFRPSSPERWPDRTISARALLNAEAPLPILKDRIVLIGGSAPDLGGLRPTAGSPLTPAVQIQADAIETVLADSVPIRPGHVHWLEIGLAVFLGTCGAAAGTRLAPTMAFSAVAALSAAYAAVATGALVLARIAMDPVTPALFPITTGAVAMLVAAQTSRRTAAAIRSRFEQYLAPSVVARIAARPDLLKLAAERREITAMATDIEAFTALTDRIQPEHLVRLLDAYFDIVIGIVVAHQGMVDKIIGDAVHALFNAPLDLPDHASVAIDAAQAILRATEAFRQRPENACLGFGRTRIGIETGPVVVGDFGTRAKLNYTAYGTAVNTAARLEALNKDLASSICVGPICRASCPARPFRSLGPVPVRGRGVLELYEPEG